MAAGERRYKRKRIWINAGFQARYTAMIVAVSVAILSVLGYLYVRTLEEQTRLMGIGQMVGPAGIGSEATARDFDEELREKARETQDLPRVIRLLGLAFILVLVLAYVGIRMTFRAAGPVYAVSRMLRNMAMGQFGTIRPLRKGDEFRFLGEDVAALRDSLRREAQGDIVMFERVIETLRALPPLEKATDRALVSELLEGLREAARAKRERFGWADENESGTPGGGAG